MEILPQNPIDKIDTDVTARFKDAPWKVAIHNLSIAIIGLGGIGSWASLLASRLDPYALYLYDPDIVETINLSGQLYSISDVQGSKVAKMAIMIRNYSNYFRIESFENTATSVSTMEDIVISAVDNMASRKAIFNYWKSNYPNKYGPRKDRKLFIDARLAAEKLQIFAFTDIDNKLIEEYEKEWLFTDEEADETTCSYKQTSFCSAIIGGLINNLCINFAFNYYTENPFIERPLPFLTEYDATLMRLKTI